MEGGRGGAQCIAPVHRKPTCYRSYAGALYITPIGRRHASAREMVGGSVI